MTPDESSELKGLRVIVGQLQDLGARILLVRKAREALLKTKHSPARTMLLMQLKAQRNEQRHQLAALIRAVAKQTGRSKP